MSTTTSLITIEQSVPLADSREIALTLGIDHRCFFRMIVEYREEIEQDFGPLRFQIAVKEGNRGGEQPKYALLTEEQAYAYMSYSKNTVQSRACKRLLVSAFTQAKTLLQETRRTVAEVAQTFLKALRTRASDLRDIFPDPDFIPLCELAREGYQWEELLNASLDPEAKLERSVERCWWNYARAELHLQDHMRRRYTRRVPSGRRVSAWAYPIEYLPAFRRWLREIYMPLRFPAYLRHRVRRIAKQQQIKARGGQVPELGMAKALALV